MTDPLHIPESERGLLRLFALDMPPQEAGFLRDTDGAAAHALGLSQARGDLIEIIDIDDLAEIGLEGYLREGCGIDPGVLEADKARLPKSGWVLTLPSQAVSERPATLKPQSKLRLIAIYGEPRVDWSAKAQTSGQAPPVQRKSGDSPRVARARVRRIGGGIFFMVMALLALALFLVLT